jgi:hypothetical protein
VTTGLYGNQQQQQQQEEEDDEEEEARGGVSNAYCPLLAASARDMIK